jgi:hypothetical protein
LSISPIVISAAALLSFCTTAWPSRRQMLWQPKFSISEKLLARLRDVVGFDILIGYRRDFGRSLF